MNSPTEARSNRRERIVGWSALGASAVAVFAWAACCVLPMALSLAGLSIVGTVLVAEQRTWLTLGAALLLAAGWGSVWRRRRTFAADTNCASPARLTIALLTVATVLTGLALIWRPLIEPWALMLLRSLRA